MKFWSSVDLTGNQTLDGRLELFLLFWSSVDLTGNQTVYACDTYPESFGAVSI